MQNSGEHYDKGGLVVITFLLLFGVGFIYFSWGNAPLNYDNFYKYIYVYGFGAIASFFFICTSIYAWTLYIKNVIIKPKEIILYLIDVGTGGCTMLDENGYQYFHFVEENIELEAGKFYVVLKTKDTVKKILVESTESFKIPKVREKFFLTWYSPMGKFENIFLLPILYVVIIPCILSIIMATGFSKIFGAILGAYPAYLILYDLYYKHKSK